jgi:hypothetical protein
VKGYRWDSLSFRRLTRRNATLNLADRGNKIIFSTFRHFSYREIIFLVKNAKMREKTRYRCSGIGHVDRCGRCSKWGALTYRELRLLRSPAYLYPGLTMGKPFGKNRGSRYAPSLGGSRQKAKYSECRSRVTRRGYLHGVPRAAYIVGRMSDASGRLPGVQSVDAVVCVGHRCPH